MPLKGLESVSSPQKRAFAPHPPTVPRPQPRRGVAADVDKFEPSRPIRRAWYSPQESRVDTGRHELQTKIQRESFLAEWERIQNQLQLGSLSDVVTKNHNVTLKGKDALVIMACQALSGYFESAFQLETLLLKLKRNPSLIKRDGFRQEYAELLNTFQALDDLIHLASLTRYWENKSKRELVTFFEQSVGIFWRNASAQKKQIGAFLDTISPEIVGAPSKIKKRTSDIISKLESSLMPFDWGDNFFFLIDNIHFSSKSLSPKTYENLKQGPINLSSEKGLNKFTLTHRLLLDSLKRSGKNGLTLEVNGQKLNTEEALDFFSRRLAATYVHISTRYLSLQDRLERLITKTDLERALRQEESSLDMSSKAKPIREEMMQIRSIYRKFSTLVFSQSVKPFWSKQEFADLTPEVALQQVTLLLKEKIPFSDAEKIHLQSYLTYIAKRLSQFPLIATQAITEAQERLWQLVYLACDSKKLDQIFIKKIFNRPEWALSETILDTVSIDEENTDWLKSTYYAAVEMVKSELSHTEQLRQFYLFISDPKLIALITKDSDRDFLSKLSSKLQTAIQNQTDFVNAENRALGLKVSLHGELSHASIDSLKTKRQQVPVEPLQGREELLRLCNLHATTQFGKTLEDAAFFLDDIFIRQWRSFLESNEREISNYWKSKQEGEAKDPLHIHSGSNDLIYIPFKRRLNNCSAFWKKVSEKAPLMYKNLTMLTYLRAKLKKDEISRSDPVYPTSLPVIVSPAELVEGEIRIWNDAQEDWV